MADLERVLNKMIADINAQQLIIMALAGQLTGMAKDWRERLEVMRTNCERGARDFQFDSGEPDGNEQIRTAMLAKVQEMFQSMHGSLLEWEKKQHPDH